MTTPGNPIRPVTSEMVPTGFQFANPGFFPFYCTAHGTNMGTGMAGVVQVIP